MFCQWLAMRQANDVHPQGLDVGGSGRSESLINLMGLGWFALDKVQRTLLNILAHHTMAVPEPSVSCQISEAHSHRASSYRHLSP